MKILIIICAISGFISVLGALYMAFYHKSGIEQIKYQPKYKNGQKVGELVILENVCKEKYMLIDKKGSKIELQESEIDAIIKYLSPVG